MKNTRPVIFILMILMFLVIPLSGGCAEKNHQLTP